MGTSLEQIAERVLSKKQKPDFNALLDEGRLGTAREYLLVGIDHRWFRGRMTFEEAQELYQMLAFPPEDAASFRQRNVGTLYFP